MDEVTVSILTLISGVVSAAALLFISLLSVKFVAKPRIDVRVVKVVKVDDEERFPSLDVIRAKNVIYDSCCSISKIEEISKMGQNVRLDEEGTYDILFYLYNRGHWYTAKPAVLDATIYVNFKSRVFELLGIAYGSHMEKKSNNIRKGVCNSEYSKAQGVFLYHGECGEFIASRVRVKTRVKDESNAVWFSIYDRNGSMGPIVFRLKDGLLVRERS